MAYSQYILPQTNFVERIHQTLGNMIRTYELENFEFDYNDPWSQILANFAWAIRSTAHSIHPSTNRVRVRYVI